jgi:hypothetical protein
LVILAVLFGPLLLGLWAAAEVILGIASLVLVSWLAANRRPFHIAFYRARWGLWIFEPVPEDGPQDA